MSSFVSPGDEAQVLRVCVLQCSYDGSESVLKDVDPYRVPEVHDKEGKYQWEHAYIKKATAVQQVRDLARSNRFDVFLNLCDGAYDEDRAGQEVVEALERHGCAYTGANREFYEPSKELMKRMAHYYDISTAPWAFVHDIDMQEGCRRRASCCAHTASPCVRASLYTVQQRQSLNALSALPSRRAQDDARALEQIRLVADGLRYPLIVKHFNGYSSVGMDHDSKVHDQAQLLQQVRKCVRAFGGALVEEFIAGREFTVLVLENREEPNSPLSLVPVECRFAPGEDFKHFDLKWHNYGSMSWVPLDAVKEPELDAQLRRQAALAFVALRGCSYGRCDFRVDAGGQVYFLEINPNCGVFYPPDAQGSADFILALDPHVRHAQFIDHIVQCALARRAHRVRARAAEAKYRHGIGYGMYATRDVEAGELVISYEEGMHCLVTQRHIRQVFGPEAVPGPCPILTHAQHWKEQQQRAQQQQPPPSLPAATAGSSNHERAAEQAGAGQCSASNGRHAEPPDSEQPARAAPPAPPKQRPDTQPAEGLPAPGSGRPAACEDDGGPPGVGGAVVAAGGTAAFVRRLKAQWVRQYAYPLTDEVWVTWSDEPEDYVPLNHSCDPNAWLEGLNLVARRPIKKGEQIRADYATFCAFNAMEFKCCCGAPACRGMVRGMDYLQPWIDQVYGSHISDYVATKRALFRDAGGLELLKDLQ